MIISSLLILLAVLIANTSHQRIVPATGRYIELSANNKGKVSDYTFHFNLEQDSLVGYDLHIRFPENDYTIPASTACTARLSSKNGTVLPCKTNADKVHVVRVDNLPSGKNYTHSVTIAGITNPNAATTIIGTGLFALKIMKESLNTFDRNDRFGMVSFAKDPVGGTLAAAITGDQKPNTLSQYKVTVTITQGSIPDMGKLRIKVPDLLTYDTASLTVNTNFLGGGAASVRFLEGNQIEIYDIPFISITNAEVDLLNVRNHGWASTSGDFKASLWSNGTNTILEESIVPATSTVNGNIPFDSQNVLQTNFDRTDYPLTPGDTHNYEIKFKTVNTVPDDCSIRIEFPATYTIQRCWAINKLIDISKTSIVTCTIVGNVMVFTNLRQIFAKSQVAVGFRAVNPVALGATPSFVIKTYYDSGITKLVDASDPITYTVAGAKPSAFNVDNLTAKRANTLISIPIDFTPSNNYGGADNLILKLRFHPDFSVVNTVFCDVVADTVTSTQPCTFVLNSNNEAEIVITSVATMTAGQTQRVIVKSVGTDGVRAPKNPGSYYVSGSFAAQSTAGLEQEHATSYITVDEAIFDPALTSVKQFTRDFDRPTVIEFALYMPFPIEQGQWVPKGDYARTYFELTFPTRSGGSDLFRVDLGSSVATGGSLPCYGAVLINKFEKPEENELECTLTHAASVGTDVTVRVEGFDAITKEGLIKIHFPNLKNQQSQIGATLKFEVFRIYQQETFKQISGTFTLPAAIPYNILDNHNNNNGLLGVTTNKSPEFFPNSIFEKSYMLIKMTPDRVLQTAGGFIMFSPPLPITDPSSYLFPRQFDISCSYNQIKVDCYSYPRTSMIMIADLPVTVPKDDEAIFRVDGFTNPSFVVDLHDKMLIWSFTADNKEDEQFTYTELPPFDYGNIALETVYVLPYRYESQKVDVTYDWIFLMKNDLPPEGKIILYFPANYYDLESSIPCPKVYPIKGVEWIDPINNPNVIKTQCSDIFSSSIVTVDKIRPIRAGTEIVIRITGVKNPAQEGWTPYFRIETKNKENYVVDRVNTISQVYITRKIDIKNIIFDSFTLAPSNGYLTGDLTLSFYPQTTIPKYGTIDIRLPAAEYDDTDYPETKLCITSGSLATLTSCTYKGPSAVITILTDEEIIVEPGMKPVVVTFPQIKNFNPELSSGVVKVTTSYDGIVLDESGSDEVNRKITTTKVADALVVSAFDYFPRNQGSPARYTWTIVVAKDAPEGRVQLIFPYEYSEGLGDNLRCFIPELLIGPNDDVKCEVSGQRLTFLNTKPMESCPCTLNLEVFGVVNPNKQTTALSKQIEVYVYQAGSHVQAFKVDTGALTFLDSPAPVLQEWQQATNLYQREVSEYTMRISLADTITANKVLIYFDEVYEVPILSTTTKIKVNSAATGVLPTVIGNAMELTESYSFSAGTYSNFIFEDIANPYKPGPHPYPILEFYETAGKKILAKTYPNLMIDHPFNLATRRNILTLDSDRLTLEPGTYSDAIYVRTDTAHTQDVVVRLVAKTSGLTFKQFTLTAGSKVASFRIGRDLLSLIRDTWVTFEYVSGNTGDFYHKIEPLKIKVVPSTTLPVRLTEFTTIPAGGRSLPLALYLEKGPFKVMTVGIYQLGRIPDRLGIWPPELVFQPGEKKKFFWISNDFASKGSEGSIVFTMKGDTKDVYDFPEREKKFYIYEGGTNPPVIVQSSIRGPSQAGKITVSIRTDSPCTVYFSVVARGTDVKFSEIRNKKMFHDNFPLKYKMGEWVQVSENYQNYFEIEGIEEGLDQELKIFVQNSDGIVAPALRHRFSTIRPELPMKVYVACEKGVNKDALLGIIKANMVSPDRVVTSNPKPTLYFLEVFQDGKIQDPGYPVNNFTESLQGKKKGIETQRINLIKSQKRNLNLFRTFIIKEEGIGDIPFNSTIYERTKVMNLMNEKRLLRNSFQDLGWTEEEISSRVEIIARYTSKEISPLTIGGNRTESTTLFTTIDSEGTFKNSTYQLPASDNYDYLEFYITASSSSSDKLAREVWYEIADKSGAIKIAESKMVNFFPGSVHLRPLQWSPGMDVYLSKLAPTEIEFKGISIAEEAAELFYIAVLLERPQYNALNRMSQDHIRYLQKADITSACTPMPNINVLSLDCDGSKIAGTERQADIVNFTRLYEKPTAEQVIAGLDMNNYKVQASGSVPLSGKDKYQELKIEGLKEKQTYVIFLALKSEGEGHILTSSKNDTISLIIRTPDPDDYTFSPLTPSGLFGLLVGVVFMELFSLQSYQKS